MCLLELGVLKLNDGHFWDTSEVGSVFLNKSSIFTSFFGPGLKEYSLCSSNTYESKLLSKNPSSSYTVSHDVGVVGVLIGVNSSHRLESLVDVRVNLLGGSSLFILNYGK